MMTCCAPADFSRRLVSADQAIGALLENIPEATPLGVPISDLDAYSYLTRYSSLPLVFEQPIQNLIYGDVSGHKLRSRGLNL